MKRRTALKALGAFILTTFGTPVKAEEPKINWLMQENDINNFIIIKKDNTELVIPFSEIVKALEDD